MQNNNNMLLVSLHISISHWKTPIGQPLVFIQIKEIQAPCIMMNAPVKSGTELFSTVTEHSSLCPCWTRTCMSICMCSCVTLPTCCGGLAQSVIQVRSTGSGLMHIGSALSGSRPGVQGVCGAQGEKKNTVEHPSASSWGAAKCSENSDLSRHDDKAQCSGSLWGAVGHRYTNHERNQSTHSGGPVFILVYRKQSFLSCSVSIFEL